MELRNEPSDDPDFLGPLRTSPPPSRRASRGGTSGRTPGWLPRCAIAHRGIESKCRVANARWLSTTSCRAARVLLVHEVRKPETLRGFSWDTFRDTSPLHLAPKRLSVDNLLHAGPMRLKSSSPGQAIRRALGAAAVSSNGGDAARVGCKARAPRGPKREESMP